jgi:hypothetical protein
VLNETAFAELGVWRIPAPVRGSQHEFRYRLALAVDGKCVLRYDNEPGKGDHRHVGRKKSECRFENAERRTRSRGNIRI